MLARFGLVRNRLRTDSPQLIRETKFGEAFEALKKSNSSTQKKVLSHPAFSVWANVAAELTRRDAHVKFPSAHIKGHLASFPRFALAAEAIEGSTSTQWEIQADETGRVILPGAGLYWDGGPASAHRRATLSLGSGRSEKWVTVPTFGMTELNWFDPSLRLVPTAFDYVELTPSDVIAWTTSLEQAFAWIRHTSTDLAAELDAGVRTLVPIRPTEKGAHASVSFREALGQIALSFSPDASTLAEAIVHEYHHTKLNALLDSDPLLRVPDAREIYYSPWRNDPRPLIGLIHGVYTFQAILRFWLDFERRGLETVTQFRIRGRTHRIHGQLSRAIQEIEAHAVLTEIGQLLVAAMKNETERLGQQLPEVDTRRAASVRAGLERHERKYATPTRRTDEALVEIEHRDEVPLPLRRILIDAELPGAQTATLPEIEALVANELMKAQPESPAWVTSLAELPSPGSALADICIGHANYALERYETAAARYREAALKDPLSDAALSYWSHAARQAGDESSASEILSTLEAAAGRTATTRRRIIETFCSAKTGA